MKKIAIITTVYTGSTLPLAKAFTEKGYIVDYYIIKNHICDVEALNCTYTVPKYGINKVPEECFKDLLSYIGNKNFNLFAIGLPRPYKTVPVVCRLMETWRAFYFKSVSKVFNKENYVFANISTRFDANEFVTFLCHCKNKVLVSLHEVSDYKLYDDSVKPTRLMKYLFKHKMQIVLHSNHTYNALKKYDSVDYSRVRIIPFGLFETFLTIPLASLQLPEKYILFYGHIFPYKGLRLLYEAVNILNDKLGDFKVVVAGKGYDSILEDITKDSRYCLINRRLTNSELVTIVSKSTVVVCPYLTVSQSGIPQTSFVFGKPIIASDLPAFREVIKENQEGLFFTIPNAEHLSRQLYLLLDDINLRNEMEINIRHFEELHPSYSWTSIADAYIDL